MCKPYSVSGIDIWAGDESYEAVSEPTWKKRGCGTSLALVLLVSCVLWAAVLVPLILWGPALWWDVRQAADLIPPILLGPL